MHCSMANLFGLMQLNAGRAGISLCTLPPAQNRRDSLSCVNVIAALCLVPSAFHMADASVIRAQVAEIMIPSCSRDCSSLVSASRTPCLEVGRVQMPHAVSVKRSLICKHSHGLLLS